MISEEQIWSYLDGGLTDRDRSELELAIVNDTAAKTLFEEISALHGSLKSEALLLSPSVSFSDKVMAAVQMAPAYTRPAKISITPFLIFILPTVLVLVALGALLAYNHVPLEYNLPVAMPNFKSFQLYFLVADILLLAYFVDRFSEYRFNRKTLFA